MTSPEQEPDGDGINSVNALLLDDRNQETERDPPSSSLPDDRVASPENQFRSFHLTSVNSTLVIRQLHSEGLSFQLWPAATTLITLLDRHRSNPASGPLSAAINGSHKILELGSGTGAVGIAAAATLGSLVTVTDLPHVLPNLRFNVESNSDVVKQNGGLVKVAALCWGEGQHMEALGEEFDLILASDVVYHSHLYDPLLRTLRFFMAEAEGTVFVMAHLRRWKKENVFFRNARKSFDVTLIHGAEPCDGSRVGVLVYSFAKKKKERNPVR